MRVLPAFALALVGLLCVLLLSGQHARADGDAKGFEYRVLDLDFAEFHKTEEWKKVLKSVGGNAFRAAPKFQEFALDYLGEQGWELVEVERREQQSTLFYFKRLKK